MYKSQKRKKSEKMKKNEKKIDKSKRGLVLLSSTSVHRSLKTRQNKRQFHPVNKKLDNKQKNKREKA